MSRLTIVCVLALCAFVTAFSLERPASQRLSGQNVGGLSKRHIAQHSNPTFLKSEGSVEIVAATPEKSTLISKIWNKDTKLFFYLAVWYIGNIYCEFCFRVSLLFLIFLIALYYFQITFTTRRHALLLVKTLTDILMHIGHFPLFR